MIECFGPGENASGSSGGGDGGGSRGGAKLADLLEGLGFGNPIMDEKRSRAVTDAFRELSEDGSGVIRAENLRRRYSTAAAAAG